MTRTFSEKTSENSNIKKPSSVSRKKSDKTKSISNKNKTGKNPSDKVKTGLKSKSKSKLKSKSKSKKSKNGQNCKSKSNGNYTFSIIGKYLITILQILFLAEMFTLGYVVYEKCVNKTKVESSIRSTNFHGNPSTTNLLNSISR